MGRNSKTALRARIEEAFAPRTYPSDDGIGFVRPGCTGYEGNLVADFFRSKDWRDVTFRDILDGYDAPIGAIPAFMLAEGLAYYLPAFLIMALDLDSNAIAADNEASLLDGFVDSLCFMLTAPSPDSLSEQYDLLKDMSEVPEEVKERLRNPTPEAKAAEAAIVEKHSHLVALLSDEQRQAVRETLEYIADNFRQTDPNDEFNNAARALASTWG